MSYEQFEDDLNKNIQYLQRNIPPDDIYLLAEHTFMAAIYFIQKIASISSLSEECEKDENLGKWVTNILSLKMCRDRNLEIKLDLDLDRANS